MKITIGEKQAYFEFVENSGFGKFGLVLSCNNKNTHIPLDNEFLRSGVKGLNEILGIVTPHIEKFLVNLTIKNIEK